MRLFVAIEFPPEIKDALSAAIVSLKSQGVSANFTRRENMHLTLAFIGETHRLAEAKAALDTVKARPFRVALGGSGAFGDLLWAGLRREPGLDFLAAKVREALNAAAFALDPKPFRPHITLARRAVCEGKPRLVLPAVSAPVTEFVLMRSDRVDGRLVYTPVFRKALG